MEELTFLDDGSKDLFEHIYETARLSHLIMRLARDIIEEFLKEEDAVAALENEPIDTEKFLDVLRSRKQKKYSRAVSEKLVTINKHCLLPKKYLKGTNVLRKRVDWEVRNRVPFLGIFLKQTSENGNYLKVKYNTGVIEMKIAGHSRALLGVSACPGKEFYATKKQNVWTVLPTSRMAVVVNVLEDEHVVVGSLQERKSTVHKLEEHSWLVLYDETVLFAEPAEERAEITECRLLVEKQQLVIEANKERTFTSPKTFMEDLPKSCRVLDCNNFYSRSHDLCVEDILHLEDVLLFLVNRGVEVRIGKFSFPKKETCESKEIAVVEHLDGHVMYSNERERVSENALDETRRIFFPFTAFENKTLRVMLLRLLRDTNKKILGIRGSLYEEKDMCYIQRAMRAFSTFRIINFRPRVPPSTAIVVLDISVGPMVLKARTILKNRTVSWSDVGKVFVDAAVKYHTNYNEAVDDEEECAPIPRERTERIFKKLRTFLLANTRGVDRILIPEVSHSNQRAVHFSLWESLRVQDLLDAILDKKGNVEKFKSSGFVYNPVRECERALGIRPLDS